jgi:hypothetical protein
MKVKGWSVFHIQAYKLTVSTNCTNLNIDDGLLEQSYLYNISEETKKYLVRGLKRSSNHDVNKEGDLNPPPHRVHINV